jgi:hypothetical protein
MFGVVDSGMVGAIEHLFLDSFDINLVIGEGVEVEHPDVSQVLPYRRE